jgi:integrase
MLTLSSSPYGIRLRMREISLNPLVVALDHPKLPGELLGCPFIQRGGPEHDRANHFLEACFLGEWSLELLRGTTVAAVVANVCVDKPAASSVFQYAYQSADVIAWSKLEGQRTGRKVSILNYDEATLSHYQSMMQSEEWSTKEDGLGRGTIKSRLENAISMAEWAHWNDMRGPTDFKRVPMKSGGWRYRLLGTATRFKRYRIHSSDFAETFIRATAGNQTYLLGSTTIVGTGLRISELCRLNVKDMPLGRLHDPSWEKVSLDIKGKGDVIRPVTFDRELIDAYDTYVCGERSRLLKKCADRYGTEHYIYKDSELALFLNANGRRLAPRSTWAAFAKYGRQAGLDNAHPHLLRHWYAVIRLRTAHEGLLSQNPNIAGDALRCGLGSVIGSIQIELGHASIETTKIYLESYFEKIAEEEVLSMQRNLLKAIAA